MNVYIMANSPVGIDQANVIQLSAWREKLSLKFKFS